MWFKSKTQHADPEVRRKYVEQLPAGDDSLLSAAVEDPHPDVRVAAVVRLEDLAALQRLATDDPDPQIRAQAMARLQTVLAGDSENIPLQRRQDFVSGCDSSKLLAFVARSGAEPELRKQALGRLLAADGDGIGDLLCDIAAEDPVSEVRETAASAIHTDTDLAKLVNRSRGRDKHIYRLAQQKLERLRAQAEAATTIKTCCAEVETLDKQPADTDPGTLETRLSSLEADWTRAVETLEGEVDASQRLRFETSRDACRKRIDAARAIRRQRHELLETLQAYVDGNNTETVADLSRRWHELGEAPPAEARRFEKLVHSAHEIDSQRDREHDRAGRADAVIAETEALIDAKTLATRDIDRLEQQWATLPLPEDVAVRDQLLARFDSARQKLVSRLERDAAGLENDLAKVGQLLDRYEQAIADGQLRNALSAHDKAASALSTLSAPEKAKKSLEERLHASEPRMSELRRWRHWGTLRAREALCKRAEAVADAGLEPPAVAREVRECREEWKKLDKADGAAGKTLWERFDGACEKAYAPCEAWFAERKEQRKANVERRIALCVKLEELAASTDWGAPPWRELGDTLRETQRDWHRAGPVDRRKKKDIDKRFAAACGAIEEHLEIKRKHEIARREGLIERVEAISEADVRDGIRIAKQAQRDWKPLVQADRKTERDLWKRFRTACDAVFERRKSEFEAADKERVQNLAEKKSVCDQLEQMTAELREKSTGISVEELNDAKRRLNLLRSGWQRIGAVPREDQQKIDRRFREACDALGAIGREIESGHAAAALERQRDVARACDAFELAIAAGETVDEAELQRQLDACAGNQAMKPLLQRIERIRRALHEDDGAAAIASALAQNLQTKQQLCLEMEIAANIDSPPEHQSERMAWRVNQLSASLSGDRRERDAETLQREWMATGAVPADQQAAITTRFERAANALDRR